MVYLSRAATEPVTVKYSTEDGSAKAGVDYVATKGSLTFDPGEVAKWITVPIIGEVAADPDEDAPVNSMCRFCNTTCRRQEVPLLESSKCIC